MTCLLFDSLQYLLNVWALNEEMNNRQFCLAGAMVLEEKWGWPKPAREIKLSLPPPLNIHGWKLG